jgi:hypothetical protein
MRSRLLYGAPIWAASLLTNRRSLLLVRRLHRTVAIRTARAYRTVSATAASLLAGFPPFELEALRCREIYQHTRAPSGGVDEAARGDAAVRARRTLLDSWRAGLATGTGAPGLRVVEAVLPNWDDWLDGGGPALTYRATQVLTGHGCFGEYLHRIGREATARCHHCNERVDSAQHTLEHCPAWALPRRALVAEIGADLSPPAVFSALLANERSRKAVATFCEQVMLRKEAAERMRERDSHPGRVGGRRRGEKRGHATSWRARTASPSGRS